MNVQLIDTDFLTVYRSPHRLHNVETTLNQRLDLNVVPSGKVPGTSSVFNIFQCNKKYMLHIILEIRTTNDIFK